MRAHSFEAPRVGEIISDPQRIQLEKKTGLEPVSSAARELTQIISPGQFAAQGRAYLREAVKVGQESGPDAVIAPTVAAIDHLHTALESDSLKGNPRILAQEAAGLGLFISSDGAADTQAEEALTDSMRLDVAAAWDVIEHTEEVSDQVVASVACAEASLEAIEGNTKEAKELLEAIKERIDFIPTEYRVAEAIIAAKEPASSNSSASVTFLDSRRPRERRSGDARPIVA